MRSSHPITRQKIASILAAILIAIGGAGFSLLRADSWMLPTPTTYFSANEKYSLEVKPKQLESQLKFFQSGGDGGAKPGVEDNWPKGFFYERQPDGNMGSVRRFGS
jgi:hypothetical protein